MEKKIVAHWKVICLLSDERRQREKIRSLTELLLIHLCHAYWENRLKKPGYVFVKKADTILMLLIKLEIARVEL